MTFWQTFADTSGLAGAFHWAVLCFLIAAVLLFKYLPGERARIRTAVVLLGVALIGLLGAAAILYSSAGAESPGYVWIRCASLLIASVAIINVTGVFIFAIVLRPAHLEPPKIAQDLLLAFAYIAIAILLLRGVARLDLGGIVATSAVLTAVIGFSLQETLGNIMGGMALQMERTISEGDWIRLDDVEGKVKEIRWRQTSIETRNWDTVVIPNSLLMKGKVTLLGRREGCPLQRRQWVHFRIDVNHPPSKVIRIVEAALCAEAIPGVAIEPPAHCLVTDFKDGDATYAVRYWLTDLARTDPTDSVVRVRIYGALQRANIPLSIPTRAVLLTEENESSSERKQSVELSRRLDALQQVELFLSLTPEEQREVAVGLERMPFAQGETLTRQGATAHRLYIIVNGEAEVHVMVEGRSRRVASLRRGDFFGEMGLLTGEPRTATVRAMTDVDCYCLSKESFEGILQRRPEIAEQMAHILARRREELDVIREKTSGEALRERTGNSQGAMLRRIREFFGLDE